MQVLVVSAGDDLLIERMEICTQLWNAGIKAEFVMKRAAKLSAQFDYGGKMQIPYAVILGKSELQNNQVKIKELNALANDKGTLINRDEMVAELKRLLRM